ncbi:MAG TPA: CAP domain-containing protein [Gemmatimonadota bacterium]|nr:CAP domain-containing protein [Gemmatimonadota bacterium]
MGRASRTILIAALAAVACHSVPPPGSETVPSAADVPIRDRYARQRLVLLDAINADRADHGLALVALDSAATVVAQVHARAMADGGYLSHYAADGRAPYERLSEAGLTAHVRENVFRWTLHTDDPAGRDWPWLQFDVRRAEEWLMASPSHRATILDPGRTHVGLGIAEDRATSSVYVVQEFLARHARLDVPPRVWRNAPTVVRGWMTAPDTRPLLVFMSREPATVPWAGGRPPGGPYHDGGTDGFLIPPWRIRWNGTDRSFSLELEWGALRGGDRWYGIVYVAEEDRVRSAIGRGTVDSGEGYPGAAFVLDVL